MATAINVSKSQADSFASAYKSITAPSSGSSAGPITTLGNQIGGAITLANQSSANPADRYSAKATAPTPQDEAIDAGQPSPQKVQATPFTNPTPTAPQTATAPKSATTINPSTGTPFPSAEYEKAYNAASEVLKKSGISAPNSAGAGSYGSQKVLSSTSQNPQPTTTPNVDNHFLSNPFTQDVNTQLMDFLSPQSTRDSLQESLKTLKTDRTELAGLKTELMNTKRIMSGTEQDIRDEITKAGGFATESQVAALTIARNKSLVARGQQLTDLIQSQQDAVANDMTMLNFEKDMANTQFTQRMALMNYQQENTKFMYSALKDSYKTLMDSNPQGLYNSLIADPVQAQRFEQVTGLNPNSLKGMIDTKALDLQLKQADLANRGADLLNKQADLRNKNAVDATVSPNTLSGMLNVYKSTGVLPTFGQSAKSPLRAQFYAALGADGNIVTDANTNKTIRAGLNTAYKTQQNQLAANQTAIGTLDKQLELVQKYSDQINRTDSPLVNKYIIGARTGVFGDPETAALNNIVKTASYEFARILSGSAASIAGVTVSSAADAESMLNSAMSKGQFTSVLNLMKQESNFRLKSQQETLSNLEKDLNNVGSIAETVKPIPPASIPSGYYQASDGLLYKKQ